ncbi:hypothetical protein [Nocardia sp. NPDC048505]|uniref:hypothetical protein n=1 Tax=unclassified Nocardia TaxID=2637762 RepID=UPI00340D4CDD
MAAAVETDYYLLCQWRSDKTVWVPRPDIRIGNRLGFSKACGQLWIPKGEPFERPETVDYLGVRQMCALHRVSRPTLFAIIGDKHIAEPVVWITDDLDDPEAGEVRGWAA